jgi:hypothetical protein
MTKKELKDYLSTFKVGDKVKINKPEWPDFHNKECVVYCITSYLCVRVIETGVCAKFRTKCVERLETGKDAFQSLGLKKGDMVKVSNDYSAFNFRGWFGGPNEDTIETTFTVKKVNPSTITLFRVFPKYKDKFLSGQMSKASYNLNNTVNVPHGFIQPIQMDTEIKQLISAFDDMDFN